MSIDLARPQQEIFEKYWHGQGNHYIELNQLSLIKIQGKDATSFLQGQLTCDVTQVPEQGSVLAALCNHQGKVQAVLTLFKKFQVYYCLLPTCISQLFVAHLNKFAVFSKVTVENITEQFFILGYIGENQPIFPCEMPEDTFSLPFPGLISRQIICGLLANRPLIKVTQISDQARWQQISILSGIPSIYRETTGVVTPHMLNLDKLGAISFDKGCYLGQEIIARTHYLGKSKRHLHLAQTDATTLKPGNVLIAQAKDAGLVIDVAYDEKGNTLLLAVIQEEALGKPLVFDKNSVKILL